MRIRQTDFQLPPRTPDERKKVRKDMGKRISARMANSSKKEVEGSYSVRGDGVWEMANFKDDVKRALSYICTRVQYLCSQAGRVATPAPPCHHARNRHKRGGLVLSPFKLN